MGKAALQGHPSQSAGNSCEDFSGASPNIVEPCIGLLNTLSVLEAQKQALDAERLESAPMAYQKAALDAVWVTRRNCDLLALAVQKAQPETGNDEAIRRDVLIYYSACINPDDTTLTALSELPLGTVRALYPAVVAQRFGSSHGFG